MDGVHFLRDLLIAFAAAGAGVFLFHRLRVPSVVGLLAAGVLAGPALVQLAVTPADSRAFLRSMQEAGVVSRAELTTM